MPFVTFCFVSYVRTVRISSAFASRSSGLGIRLSYIHFCLALRLLARLQRGDPKLFLVWGPFSYWDASSDTVDILTKK